MKRILLAIPILLMFSCKKDKESAHSELITKGDKWGIQIGSSPADVYGQIQKVAVERGIDQIGLFKQPTYTKPEEIKDSYALYQGLALESKGTDMKRVILQFNEDKVSLIIVGGANPPRLEKWPEDAADIDAIHPKDPVSGVYDKLLTAYKTAPYKDYNIHLSGKRVSKPFDPNMAKTTEWYLYATNDAQAGKSHVSTMRLIFKSDKLESIKYEYNDQIVYDWATY